MTSTDSSLATTDSARRSLADAGAVLGPLDGRYRSSVSELTEHLSEAALNRNRVVVEVEWFIHLCELQVLPGLDQLSADQKHELRRLYTEFDATSIAELAEFEATTVHDVKAVEYFICAHLKDMGLQRLTSLVHFACTSEDINNLAYALGIRDAIHQVWIPRAQETIDTIAELAQGCQQTPMLSRTHGQPATPTTLGKELAVFVHRLQRQLDRISRQQYLGKINGATGTYAAHHVAVPHANWPVIAQSFVESLGLSFNPLTTQIESHDYQAELYDDLSRFNQILHGFCQDVWSYISIGYFTQVPVAGATGSSTMPHKVNPIRFENAEANCELSNAILHTLGQTLIESRWQRDLTDSTSQRNIGVGLGHSVLALSNVTRGLGQLTVAEQVLAADLENNWEVLGEAIQTVMRAEAIAGTEGMEQPYERLKELTRGQRVTPERMREFVRSLGLSSQAEEQLLKLTPATYTGVAAQLAAETLEGRR
ncbi:adenylosuccinate lyase [Auritidibacter ignavus]|uniref:adenylosuccinate lyase n=1 Tax=Auritidibacter ignavus TaxID=678932 RepID=UPI00109CB6C8|nr:adenylosuccinate lyase [Auritidibacter ignavus]